MGHSVRGAGALLGSVICGCVLLTGGPASAAALSVDVARPADAARPAGRVAVGTVVDAAMGAVLRAAAGAGVPGWVVEALAALALGTVVLATVVGVVGARRRRTARRHEARLRAVGFRAGARREVVVAPGPDGRPGERFVAPSRSPQVGVVEADGCRADATVVLTARGSELIVRCFGRQDAAGDPRDHLTATVERLRRQGRRPGATTETKLAGEPAVVARLVRPDGAGLLEHRFVKDGWLYGVCVQSVPGDGAAAEAVAREVLDTWEWLH